MRPIVCLAAVLSLCASALAMDVNIADFGATGDGETLDSAAIQKAIDAAHAAGGGKVTVPKGSYLAGTIVLKDNITLHLDDGAEILGTTDHRRQGHAQRQRQSRCGRQGLQGRRLGLPADALPRRPV
jgi:polygalacturonase